MADRPTRDPSTHELLAALQRRRALRRTLMIGGAALASVGFVGLAVFAALVTFDRPGGPDGGTTPTTPLVSATTTTATPPPPSTHTLPSRPSTTDTSAPAPDTTAPPSTGAPVTGWLVVVDPGHQRRGNSVLEPIGPGSATTKAKVSSGTTGVATDLPESELVLAVGLMVREELEARGVRVIMTRTTQDVDISNVERTRIANDARAGLYIRVHADGAENRSIRGIHVLYPAVTRGWTDDIAAPSKRAAELAQAALIAATGAPDRGIDARSDMTGFNWSDVPVIIPEIGFMSNPEEDRLLSTPAYQRKIAVALAEAAVQFLRERG